MKRLIKILLGLSVGAAVAVLFAPKSGRELREQLIGGATAKLLPAAPIEFPEPEGERHWGAGAATAVAEPPEVEPAFEEPASVVEAAVVEEVVVAEPELTEEARTADLRARIEETRAAVETDIAQPFAPVVAEEAIVAAPAVSEAVAEEPVAEVPAEAWQAAEIAYSESDVALVAEPRSVAPAAEEPTSETPVVDEPLVEETPVSEAAAGLVADITTTSEAAVVEETPTELVAEPVEETPAEPVAEPVAEAPAAEAPAVEEPVVEDIVAEDEPVAHEDGTINQAEMRHRIEETRARLKAKAFDAMMSGEAALLSRDSGDKPVPKGEDVKLDGELESTIDESLSPEEY